MGQTLEKRGRGLTIPTQGHIWPDPPEGEPIGLNRVTFLPLQVFCPNIWAYFQTCFVR